MNSLSQHVAVEEPDITSVAISPGRVDTDMQKELREKGAPGIAMSEKDYAGFKTAFEEGKLNKVEWPAHVIARLAVGAEPELSGKYLRFGTPSLDTCPSLIIETVGMRLSSSSTGAKSNTCV